MAWSGRAIDALLGAAFSLLLLTGLPPACNRQNQLREAVVGALTAVGICQPRWRLFAPNVHKTNSYITAEVVLASGEKRHWSSPSFAARSWGEKLVQGQLPKLYDNLRLDKHRAAWRPFAGFLERQIAPGQDVTSVRLTRHYYEIPPPSAPNAWSTLPPPRASYREHLFYARRRP